MVSGNPYMGFKGTSLLAFHGLQIFSIFMIMVLHGHLTKNLKFFLALHGLTILTTILRLHPCLLYMALYGLTWSLVEWPKYMFKVTKLMKNRQQAFIFLDMSKLDIYFSLVEEYWSCPIRKKMTIESNLMTSRHLSYSLWPFIGLMQTKGLPFKDLHMEI